jgi:hypothetical protein
MDAEFKIVGFKKSITGDTLGALLEIGRAHV